MDTLEGFRAHWQPQIDQELGEVLEQIGRDPGCPQVLHKAMRQAVLGGGKRLRPLICLAAQKAAGGAGSSGLRAACAIEFIHAYSLVHDDLPAMDDDDFRRGQPTCHKVYGEALAILTGDGLLTQAFSVLVQGVPAARAAEAVQLMATCAGTAGMVGGQVDDVDELPGLTQEVVERIHLRKTAALFELSARLGGLLAGATREQLDSFSAYGRALGLAYQIVDDLRDADAGRSSHPKLAGEQVSRQRAKDLVGEAKAALESFGDQAVILRELARFVAERAG